MEFVEFVEACGSLWKRILIESIHVEHVIEIYDRANGPVELKSKKLTEAEMKFADCQDFFSFFSLVDHIVSMADSRSGSWHANGKFKYRPSKCECNLNIKKTRKKAASMLCIVSW